MRVLLDENLPIDLANHIKAHLVETVASKGWQSFTNGELLGLARADFDCLLTLDRGILYQHAHAGEHMSVIVLRAKNNQVETLLEHRSDTKRARQLSARDV